MGALPHRLVPPVGASADSDHRAVELPSFLEAIESPEGHLPGQVSGDAEDDQGVAGRLITTIVRLPFLAHAGQRTCARSAGAGRFDGRCRA